MQCILEHHKQEKEKVCIRCEDVPIGNLYFLERQLVQLERSIIVGAC